jgi:hypothetical protein
MLVACDDRTLCGVCSIFLPFAVNDRRGLFVSGNWRPARCAPLRRPRAQGPAGRIPAATDFGYLGVKGITIVPHGPALPPVPRFQAAFNRDLGSIRAAAERAAGSVKTSRVCSEEGARYRAPTNTVRCSQSSPAALIIRTKREYGLYFTADTYVSATGSRISSLLRYCPIMLAPTTKASISLFLIISAVFRI